MKNILILAVLGLVFSCGSELGKLSSVNIETVETVDTDETQSQNLETKSGTEHGLTHITFEKLDLEKVGRFVWRLFLKGKIFQMQMKKI